MIAGLQGVVDQIGADYVMVNVGGVVFQVLTASSTLSSVSAVGSNVTLHTYLQVRDDGLTLYGFAGKRELQLFQMLLTVNGVGPRSGLALLSAIPVDQLATAIAMEDTTRLSSVTGIGKRTAARIVLELKGKLGSLEPGIGAAASFSAAAELVLALTSLGYSNAEAAAAIRSLPNIGSMGLEDGLREALRVLSTPT